MAVLDGNLVSRTIRENIKKNVYKSTQDGQRSPKLCAIIVGDDPASHTYVRNKAKDCAEVGFDSEVLHFQESASELDLLQRIEEYNQNPAVDGIIVQLPLPKHIDSQKITNSISYKKDVDGFHDVNIGRLCKGLDAFLPATPYGIVLLLEHYKISVSGKHCVVIGRSNIVGRPLSILLSLNKEFGNSTVTLCHSRTKNLKELTLQADIVFTALGRAHFLTEDMVKEDVIIIDVGINKQDAPNKKGYQLVGDASYNSLKDKASFITPVPGGVGPMTRAALLMNTLKSYEQKYE